MAILKAEDRCGYRKRKPAVAILKAEDRCGENAPDLQSGRPLTLHHCIAEVGVGSGKSDEVGEDSGKFMKV